MEWSLYQCNGENSTFTLLQRTQQSNSKLLGYRSSETPLIFTWSTLRLAARNRASVIRGKEFNSNGSNHTSDVYRAFVFHRRRLQSYSSSLVASLSLKFDRKQNYGNDV